MRNLALNLATAAVLLSGCDQATDENVVGVDEREVVEGVSTPELQPTDPVVEERVEAVKETIEIVCAPIESDGGVLPILHPEEFDSCIEINDQMMDLEELLAAADSCYRSMRNFDAIYYYTEVLTIDPNHELAFSRLKELRARPDCGQN